MSDRFPPSNTPNARKTLMNRYQTPIHRTIRAMADRFRLPLSDSLGITLMETVIALAMFSSAGTAVLLGVSAAHTSSDRVSARAIAENLARNQMEYVNSQSYVAPGGNYTSIADDVGLNLTIPSGFAVTAAAQTYLADDGLTGSIEKVVVTITRDGQSIWVLESLRAGP